MMLTIVAGAVFNYARGGDRAVMDRQETQLRAHATELRNLRDELTAANRRIDELRVRR